MFLLSFQAKGIALKNTKSCFPARLACCDLRPSGSRKSRGAGGLACGESPTRSTRASSMQSRSGSRLALGSAPGFFLGRPTGRFFSAAAGRTALGPASFLSLSFLALALAFFRCSFWARHACAKCEMSQKKAKGEGGMACRTEPQALRKAPPPPSPSSGHPRAPNAPSPPGRQRWRPRPRRSRAYARQVSAAGGLKSSVWPFKAQGCAYIKYLSGSVEMWGGLGPARHFYRARYFMYTDPAPLHSDMYPLYVEAAFRNRGGPCSQGCRSSR